MQSDLKPKRLSSLQHQHQILNARFDHRGGWLIPEAYSTTADETKVLRESVGLIDISAWGKLILKGAYVDAIVFAYVGEAPAKPGNAIEIKSDHTLVAKLAPDQVLILTPPGAEKGLATSLEAEITTQATFVSVIDVTSGLVGLSIAGPKSMVVMSKLCAIPFNSKEPPGLWVVQSSFAQVRATIVRHHQDASPAFKLFADCSYGEYLWEVILDAGREFGILPVGWGAIGG